MRRNLTIAAIVSGFTGCVFGVLAAWKIEQMFTANSFSLGWGEKYSGPFWDHVLLLSFLFGALAFILEFIAVCLEKDLQKEEFLQRKHHKDDVVIPAQPTNGPDTPTSPTQHEKAETTKDT